MDSSEAAITNNAANFPCRAVVTISPRSPASCDQFGTVAARQPITGGWNPLVFAGLGKVSWADGGLRDAGCVP